MNEAVKETDASPSPEPQDWWTHVSAGRLCDPHVAVPGLVFSSLFFDFVCQDMGVAVIPDAYARLGLPSYCNAIQLATKPVIQMLSSPIVGPSVDRGSAQNHLLAGMAILAATSTTFGLGLVFRHQLCPWTTFAVSVTSRAVQGVGSALVASAGMTWIARTHSSEERPAAMGFAMVGMGAGILFGVSPSGFVARAFGVPSPFMLIAALLLLQCAAIECVVTTEVNAEEATDTKKDGSFFAQLTDTHILSIDMQIFTASVVIGFFQAALGPHVDAVLGAPPYMQGLLWLVDAVAFLVCRLLNVWLMTKCSDWVILSMGTIMEGASCMLISIFPSWYLIWPGMVLMGAGDALMFTPGPPMLANIVELADCRHNHGSVFAMIDVAACLGFILGPLCTIGPPSFWVKSQLFAGFCFLNLIGSVHLRTLKDRAAANVAIVQ